MQYGVVANEPGEKVTFPKIASSAGSKIENHFLSLKVLGAVAGYGLNV
jgi:hypothetical protein